MHQPTSHLRHLVRILDEQPSPAHLLLFLLFQAFTMETSNNQVKIVYHHFFRLILILYLATFSSNKSVPPMKRLYSVGGLILEISLVPEKSLQFQ